MKFRILGAGGGEWGIIRQTENWILEPRVAAASACEVVIEGEIAWRILTKGISRAEAMHRVTISGRRELGEPVFELLSVMA